MTAAAAPARHASLPARTAAELTWRLAQHMGRLAWDAGRLAAHQRERLRMLLAYAAEYSPFHARRLRGLDLSRFETGDLGPRHRLPRPARPPLPAPPARPRAQTTRPPSRES
jgi:hypothetical protein